MPGHPLTRPTLDPDVNFRPRGRAEKRASLATTLTDARLPIQGMLTLRYAGEDGKTFDIEPYEANRFDVQPLNFTELIQAVTTKCPEIPLVISNVSAPSAETGLEFDGPHALRINWVVNSPVLAYGLVDGGWLPLPWAHKRIAWLDRNVVIELEKLQSAGYETLGAGEALFALCIDDLEAEP